MITPIIILCLLAFPLFIGYIATIIKKTHLKTKKYACWGLGIAFIFFFIGHLVKTDGMIEMLPGWVPFREAIIYITGFLELAVGVALFLPRYQPKAAKLAIVIFVVFFPANIYAAMNSIGLGGHQWGPEYLLIRTPLQIILILWTYYLCLEKHK